jgi:hypothetical protein
MNNFDIDFVRNTKEVLVEYGGKYDVSNLLNCTLGLIILPYERVKATNQPFWETKIDRFKDLPPFELRCFKPIKGRNRKTRTLEYYPETLEFLLKKIRNGLAHQNIEPVAESKIFKGVIIRNYYGEAPHRVMDLEVEFSKEQLKGFALFIAEQYLRLSALH